MAFAVGVSVGRAGEPSAIAVLEVVPTARSEDYLVTVVADAGIGVSTYEDRRTRRVDGAPCAFAVRHLERFAAGAGYTAMAKKAADAVRRLPNTDALTVLDVTGVGRPMLALFHRHGLEPVAVTVMAGGRPALAQSEYTIPKGDLISLLQIALHDGRLKIAGALPDAGTLRAELLNFRLTATGSADVEAWRDGAHDDLVFAVAVAAFVAQDMYLRPAVGNDAAPPSRYFSAADEREREHSEEGEPERELGPGPRP